MNPKRLIVGITGASGSIYGIRILQALKSMDVETHLIISRAARQTIPLETDQTVQSVEHLADVCHNPSAIGASIASGSFETLGMVIAPCSIKTLSGIAHSYTDDLISRAADVTLKEGRTLVLVVRETPLHVGHLRLMTQAAEMGAVIMPPVPAFYAQPATLEDMVNQTVGHILARMGFPNSLYRQWNGP